MLLMPQIAMHAISHILNHLNMKVGSASKTRKQDLLECARFEERLVVFSLLFGVSPCLHASKIVRNPILYRKHHSAYARCVEADMT